MLVLFKHDHTLPVVNPTTLQVIAGVPVGNGPHEVIASTDGARAYVSNDDFGALHTLAVVDLMNEKATATIDLAEVGAEVHSPNPLENSRTPVAAIRANQGSIRVQCGLKTFDYSSQG